jgi:hypothetical protein
MKKLTVIAAAVAICFVTSNRVDAAAVTVPQDTLLGMVDITTVFGPTQESTITNTVPNAGGVAYLVNWDDSGESFTRVVLQGENFDADFSAFDSFDLQFTAFTEDIGVKPYIQTGAGFAFFETAFTSIAVSDGPTVVSLDLTGVPDTDLIQQFGYQIFGPGGQDVNSSVLVQPAPGAVPYVPEPATSTMLVLSGLIACGLRRRS